MADIIRPTFGKPRDKPDEDKALDVEGGRTVFAREVFGEAAGYHVMLVLDEEGPEGEVFKVVVGPADGNVVEPAAVLPATPEGEADAIMVAMGILRALEMIERVQDIPPPGA